MTSLAAMFPENDPARHTDDLSACPVCRRDRAELISRVERLQVELREERAAHERTKALLAKAISWLSNAKE